MALEDFYAALNASDPDKLKEAGAVTNLNTNAGADPDDYAKRLRYQKDTGTPAVLMDDPAIKERVKKDSQARDFDVSGFPGVTDFVYDPNNAPLVVDDIPGLKGFEGKTRKLSSVAGDIGVSALKGAISLPQAFVGLADIPTGGYVGKVLNRLGYRPDEAQKILDDLYSDEQKEANKRVDKAEGFSGTAMAALENPSVIGHTIIQSLPSMIGGGAIGRGLLKIAPKLSPLLAGAAGEGAISAGSAAEQIRAQTDDELLNLKQTGAAVGSGIGTALFSVLGGKVAKRLGIADVDILLVTGKGYSQGARKMAARRFLEGAVTEGVLEELPQSAQEQMWQNYGTNRPLFEGVEKAAVLGMFAGMAMGSGANVMDVVSEHKAAKQTNAIVDTLTSAEATRLLERSPEKFSEFVQRLGEVHGIEAVYLQADKAVGEMVKQGVQEEAIPAWFMQYGVSPQELTTAIQTGGHIQMDFGKVASSFKNDAVLQALQSEIMVDPNVVSASRVKDANEADQAHLEHLNEMYNMDQANKINTDDIAAWEEAILQTPGIKQRVTREGLSLLSARANVLSSLTGVPAIEHLNAMLQPTGVQTMKYKDFEEARKTGAISPVSVSQESLKSATQEFKNWFGGSKVVDEEGKPLIVYHGGGSKGIQIFNTESGTYFSDDKDLAESFSEQNGLFDGEGVYPAYLSIQNPKLATHGGVNLGAESSFLTPERIAEYKDQGYDGIISRLPNGKIYEIVAFSPEQIKSVDNRGTWDTNDPNIYHQSFSTRLPKAVSSTEDPQAEILKMDYHVALQDEKTLAKNAAVVAAYPNMRKLTGKGAKSPARIIEAFVEHLTDNLLRLHDSVPADMRERAEMWYEGGRKIIDNWTTRFGISPMQGAAAVAALSPQKDWFMNISLAERVANTLLRKMDFRWTDAMTKAAEEMKGGLHDKMRAAQGKTLREVLAEANGDYEISACWIRAYDEAHNDRSYRILTPEGGVADHAKKLDGTNKTAGWSSYKFIGKAISVLVDGNPDNVFKNIGDEAKVRNFYNNLFDPNSEHGFVTVDTHAVAAALLRPFSGTDLEVKAAWGSAGSSSSDITGMKGLYPFYAEAYRRAAEQRGILPRQMQSITWEAVRGLFESTKKNDLLPVVDAVWGRYKSGEIDQAQAQQEIFNLAGAVTLPDWSLLPFNDTVSRTYTNGIITKIAETVRQNPNGFTIRVSDGTMMTSGLAVAPSKQTQTQMPVLTEAALEDFLDKYEEVFDNDPRAFLGGWYDSETGSFMLDISYVVTDRTEALYLAELGSQDAIWDLDNSEEIRTQDGIRQLKEAGIYDASARDALQGIQESLHTSLQRSGALRKIGGVFYQSSGRIPAGATQDVRAGARAGFGESQPGSVAAVGVHYSRKARKKLSSGFFGSGSPSAEAGRLAGQKDLQDRLYFYVNTGNGIQPEPYVGDYPHVVNLENLYDKAVDPLDLMRGNANEFERAVMAAGFDGILDRNWGVVVLLGKRTIAANSVQQVENIPEVAAPAYSDAQLLSDELRANKELPQGSPSGPTWAEWLKDYPDIYNRLNALGAIEALKSYNKPLSRSELPFVAQTLYQTAWHGGPHDVTKSPEGRFSTKYIGTGEGAQTYGYGLYFAGEEEVGRYYKEKLAPRYISEFSIGSMKFFEDAVPQDYSPRERDGDDAIPRASLMESIFIEEHQLMDAAKKGVSLKDVVVAIIDDWLDVYEGEPVYTKYGNKIKKAVLNGTMKINFEWTKDEGHLYKVELAPEEDEYLLWDKPLSEQSEKVQKLLAEKGAYKYAYDTPRFKLGGGDYYKRISSELGSDKDASEYLHSLGIRGIKYLDQISREEGDGTYNYVIFSDDDIEIREMYQKQQDTPLGALSIQNGHNIIYLFEKSDKSTFLHETAHIFLNDLKRVAETYGVQVAEWNKVREWLGVGEDGILTREMHEKFAENFEAYLMGGQAPSIPLRNAFRSFKKWLVSIYEALTSKRAGQRDIVVAPEIAEIFDRLLATEQEIQLAKEQSALIAMLDERLLNETGFTPSQIQEYKNIVSQASDSARERRDRHKMAGRSSRVAEWRKTAQSESLDVPLFGFIEKLKTERIFIDRRSIVESFGEEGIPATSPIFKADGLNVNVAIAEHGKEFGYESAGHFVGDLRATPSRKRWIQKRVAQMEVAHDMQQDTQDAIRTASLRRQLEIESQWLAEQAEKEDADYAKRQAAYEQRWQEAEAAFAEAVKLGKKDEELQVLKDRIKRIRDEQRAAFRQYQAVPARELRVWAAGIVGNRTIRQIHTIGQLLSESRMNRQQAIKFARQGKWADALIANEHSRMTEALIASSYKARNKWNRMESRWRSIAKWTNDNKSVKIGTEFRDQINRVLQQYGISKKEFDPAAPDLHSFVASLSENELDSNTTALADWIGVAIGNYNSLSWDRLQELGDALNYLYGHGRDQLEGEKLTNGVYVAEYAGDIAAAQEGLKGLPDLKSDATRTGKILQGIQKGYRKFFANTGILRFIAQRMDGYRNVNGKGMGPAEQLVQNIIAGMAQSNDMWLEISKQVEPLMKLLSKDTKITIGDIPLPYAMQRAGMAWNKERIVAACLNMGNASNLQRLMDGFGIQEADVHILAGKLTAEEWQAIQKIWDAVDSLWPRVADVHERINYFRPKKIDRQKLQVSTADGQSIALDGGYYPVMYDKTIDRDIAKWTEKDDILASHEATLQVPVAKSGFTKGRAGKVTRPLALTLSVLGQHFNDTIRYITLAEAIRDADRVFNNRELAKQNLETIGRDMQDMIRPALKQTLRPMANDMGWFEKSRVLMSIYYMGYNTWTALQNITGVFPSMYQAGMGNYINGVYQVLKMGNPFKAYKAMLEASAYMRLRASNIERDMKKQLRDFHIKGITINGTTYNYDDVKSLGFVGIRFVDTVVSLPAWWGVYNSEMDNHGDVQKATDAADAAVNKALGSGLSIDTTGIGRHPFFALLAPFMSFASTQQEVMATQREAWKEDKISSAEFLYGHLMTWVLPAVLSTFLQGAMMYGIWGALGGGDDKKKKDARDYVTDLISYRLMGIPFVRDAYNALIQGVEHKAPVTSARMPATEGWKMVQQFYYRVGQLDGEEKTTKAAMWSAAELASLASGVPVTRIYDRWSKGTKQIENGDGWFGNHFIPQEKKKN